jgi:hypothetical protein
MIKGIYFMYLITMSQIFKIITTKGLPIIKETYNFNALNLDIQ